MAAIGDSSKATLPDTEFVAPDAPFAHRSGGRQWFAVDDQIMRPDRIQAVRKAFDDLVSEILKREGFEDALDKVAFVGASQGAIMALDAVATGRWKVGALVSFAGLLPLPPNFVLDGDPDFTHARRRRQNDTVCGFGCGEGTARASGLSCHAWTVSRRGPHDLVRRGEESGRILRRFDSSKPGS
jgi:pimeloyl-ACP methyl ester carboxylesterase